MPYTNFKAHQFSNNITTPCGKVKTYGGSSEKQLQLWFRLHKKKCPTCKDAQFMRTDTKFGVRELESGLRNYTQTITAEGQWERHEGSSSNSIEEK